MSINKLLKKETVAESAGIVLFFVVLQRILQMGRGIIFARILGPGGYGVYTLAFMFIPLVAIVARLGIPSCFMRYIPYYEKQGMLKDFIRKTYFFAIGATIVVVPPCFLFSKQIAGLVFDSVEYQNIIIICLASILPYTFYESMRATFNGMRVFKLSYLMEFSHFIFFSILGIGLVVFYRNVDSVIIANLVVLIFVVIVFGFVIFKYVAGSDSQQLDIRSSGFFKKIFRFSIWFTISPFVYSVHQYTDSWMLNRFLGLEEVGIYSAAKNVSGLIFIFGMAVAGILSPTLSLHWEAGEKKRAISILDFVLRSNTLVLVCAAAALLLMKNALITILYGSEYTVSASFVNILLIFWLLNCIVYIISGYSGLIEKTYIPLIGNGVGLVVNAILCYTMIPIYGIMGAAVATTLSMVVILVIIFGWCCKEGYALRANTLFVCLLPAVFVLNEIFVVITCLAITGLTFGTELLMTREEKNDLYVRVKGAVLKLKRG